MIFYITWKYSTLLAKILNTQTSAELLNFRSYIRRHCFPMGSDLNLELDIWFPHLNLHKNKKYFWNWNNPTISYPSWYQYKLEFTLLVNNNFIPLCFVSGEAHHAVWVRGCVLVCHFELSNQLIIYSAKMCTGTLSLQTTPRCIFLFPIIGNNTKH